MGIKRGLVLATAVAALSVPLAGTAHATTGNGKADCAMTGQAATNPPIMLGGSSGTYLFLSITADCVVNDATDGTVVADLAIGGAGTYESKTCGTGTITDTDAWVSLKRTAPSGKLGDEFPV